MNGRDKTLRGDVSRLLPFCNIPSCLFFIAAEPTSKGRKRLNDVWDYTNGHPEVGEPMNIYITETNVKMGRAKVSKIRQNQVQIATLGSFSSTSSP